MTVDIHAQKMLILDFGSQYTQLIARRIRELNVYSEIHPYDVDSDFIKTFSPSGIILSGGPETAVGMSAPRVPDIVFELGCPLLGICYGMQAMAAQLGGEVQMAEKREYGYALVEAHGHSQLLSSIEDHTRQGKALLDVWMSHGDRVTKLPKGFRSIARTKDAPYAGMANGKRQYYGLQFHPEVTHTKQGIRILARFIYDICGCEPLWTSGHIIEESLAHLRKTIGKDRVLLGLSGGVDSSVVAALLHKAIGDQLVCVFVDHGLMRLGETEQVMETFAKHFGIKVVCVHAKQRFFQALVGIGDPEKKRRIIGEKFIEVFEKEARKVSGIKWLAQGTIYPDVIESAGAKTGKASVIKTHHNVGGLPEKMHLSLVEPLRELFKDEVRQIGLELGLPSEMISRHPFPGPGLGVRILGEVKEKYVDLLRRADAIFIEELRLQNLYDQVGQAFAVFLPVKSVGVMGDARKYEYVIALRAVETIDFMTARWARLSYALLDRVSNRIINEVSGISRVVYDISSKPPATIEWE